MTVVRPALKPKSGMKGWGRAREVIVGIREQQTIISILRASIGEKGNGSENGSHRSLARRCTITEVSVRLSEV
jgi:hypothetical protein